MRHFSRGLGGANPIVETLPPETGRFELDELGGRGKGRVGPGGVFCDDDDDTGEAGRDTQGGTGGSGRGCRFKELSLLTSGSGLSSFEDDQSLSERFDKSLLNSISSASADEEFELFREESLLNFRGGT